MRNEMKSASGGTEQFDTSKYSVAPFQKRVDKPWGYEIIYTIDDAPAVGKILYVNAGKRLSLQYHDEKVEALCLIKGEATMTLSNTKGKQQEISMELEKGYFVRPGQIHRISALTDIIFIESSTPETGNTFRLEDDAKRTDETESMRQSVNRGWQK